MIQRKWLPSIEAIKESTSISTATKRLLDTIPEQELEPLQLTLWIRKVVNECRKLGHNDKEIAQWIRIYAYENGWALTQISAVLRNNGIKVYWYEKT